MTWQLCVLGYLVLSTAAGLLQRKLGQAIPQHNRLVNGIFFLGVHYPAGLIAAALIGFDLNIGWFNLLVLLAAGIAFPLIGLLTFRASKDVDAGLFGILQNLQPVIIIALAALLLSDRLSPHQFIGALVVLLSALLVSVISYNHSSKSTRFGVLVAVLAVSLMGLATVYETWMLQRIGFGSYLVYGWGLQTFWMLVLAWPERRHIKEVINRKYGPQVIALSVSKSLKGFAFLGALYISNSASLVSAFSSFLPVMLVGAGWLFLREKKDLRLKIIAAAIGSVGLIILSLG